MTHVSGQVSSLLHTTDVTLSEYTGSLDEMSWMISSRATFPGSADMYVFTADFIKIFH